MKTTIQIEGCITAEYQKWNKNYCYRFIPFSIDDEYSSRDGRIPVAPYVIEIELPSDIDMQKATIAALQQKRKLILAQNEINVQTVDAEIQEFMAIEHRE